MSATGLEVFDKSLQTTHIWLQELMQDEAIGPDRQVAWHVLGAVLRAVRDRVPVELASHFGAQLPLLVRGAFYDQFRPSETPSRLRSLDEFLAGIGEELATIRPVNVHKATRAVFHILSRHMNRGQVEKVRNALPEEVRNIWPDSPDAPDVRVRPERYRAGTQSWWRSRQLAGSAPSAGQVVFLVAGMAAAAAGIAYAFNRNRQRFLEDHRNIDRRWDRPDRLADTSHEDRELPGEWLPPDQRAGLRSHSRGFAI
jgi:uncharacterized protein (DUF2267 family)